MLKNNSSTNLPTMCIIGGDFGEYYWNIKDEKNMPVDVEYLTCVFSLNEFSDRNGAPVLTKQCTPIALTPGNYNTFSLVLNTSDTSELFGNFVYQMTITRPDGKSKSKQGILTILKNINPMLSV